MMMMAGDAISQTCPGLHSSVGRQPCSRGPRQGCTMPSMRRGTPLRTVPSDFGRARTLQAPSRLADLHCMIKRRLIDGKIPLSFGTSDGARRDRCSAPGSGTRLGGCPFAGIREHAVAPPQNAANGQCARRRDPETLFDGPWSMVVPQAISAAGFGAVGEMSIERFARAFSASPVVH